MYKLSILVHGTDEDHEAVRRALNVLQHQLNELGCPFIEVKYYIGSDRTEEKRKRVLLACTYGEFYHEIKRSYIVPAEYIQALWLWLSANEKNEAELAKLRIYKRKPWQINKNLPPLHEDDPLKDLENDSPGSKIIT